LGGGGGACSTQNAREITARKEMTSLRSGIAAKTGENRCACGVSSRIEKEKKKKKKTFHDAREHDRGGSGSKKPQKKRKILTGGYDRFAIIISQDARK